MEYDELIEFSERDLRDILDPKQFSTLKPVHVGKLVNILRNVEQSTINMASKTQKLRTVILSTEEEQAIQNVKKNIVTVKENILSIDNTIEELEKNRSTNEAEIEQRIESIITAAHRRKQELKLELNRIAQEKRTKLMKQRENLQSKEQALDQCSSAAQDLINDAALDATKRKLKILEITNTLLSDAKIGGLQLVSSAVIDMSVPTEDILASILTLGTVEDLDAVKLPVLSIKSVQSDSVTLNVVSNEKIQVMGYTVKYTACESDEDMKDPDDDEMSEWDRATFQSTANVVDYELAPLNASTKYNVVMCIFDAKGLIHQSNRCSFCTSTASLSDRWDTFPSSCTLQDSILTVTKSSWCSAFGSMLCSDGVHEWVFELKQIKGWFLIGIYEDLHGIKLPKYTWFTSNRTKGKSYAIDVKGGCRVADTGDGNGRQYGRKCNEGDTVKMILDLERKTLSYCINETSYGDAFHPTRATYRAAVCMNHTGAGIELKSYRKL